MEKMNYGFIDPKDCIEQNTTIHQEDSYEEFFEDDDFIEIPLYDFEKTKEENLETGVKYLLVPIRKSGFGVVENEQLLSEFSKIILKQEDLFQCDSDGHHLIVVDYATMFGLRLNRFKNYNSDFFICDERVLFEFLIMKNQYFKNNFKSDNFFLSFPTIFKEMGIKKDRAVTIINKFKKLGFLKSEIKSSLIDGKPRQVTYYTLQTDKIIDLIPEIYLDEETEWDIKNDIKKYLQTEVKLNKPSEIIHKENLIQ